MPPFPPPADQAGVPPPGTDFQKGQPGASAQGNFSADLDRWIATLSQAEIPVLRSTIEELARLGNDEDSITAREISGVILRDPMLTLRVLRYLQEFRKKTQAAEITTVEHAVMMLGVTPFFRKFRDMKVVEEVLADSPHALEGLMGVVNRARHAALHAREWAALRHDTETDEVIIGALLHDVAEMLLWCLAPEAAVRIAERMQQDRTLRSAAAQEDVLGFRLIDLQRILIEKWHLPTLLQSLMDDDHANLPRARIVVLAAALARHSARGWNDAALSDDYAAIQKFLVLPRHEVMERIRRVALRAVRGLGGHGTVQPAAWIPPLPATRADTECNAGGESAAVRPAVLKRVTELLTVRAAQSPDFLEMLSLAFHGMRAGIGLDCVLFMEIDDQHSKATARYLTGSAEASRLRKLQMDLVCPHAFSRLMSNMAGVWYRAADRNELKPLVPQHVLRIIGENEFFVMAIPVRGNPIGLIYADGGQSQPVLDAGRYAEFQGLCQLLAESLERGPQTAHFR